MRLSVQPADGLITVESDIRITGLFPRAAATLTVEVVDAAGNQWMSENTFVSDDAGKIDLSWDAPREGSYRGIDPTGPWWSMRFRSPRSGPAAFASSADHLVYSCRVSSGVRERSVDVIRRWSHGVERSEVQGDGFTGSCFEPARRRLPVPGVLLVPGTTGPEPMLPLAALLASHGFAAMVVSYLGQPGLPDVLSEIPVEVVPRALRLLAEREDVDGDRLSVVASSAGTEGALTALAHGQSEVCGVVAIAPSSVVWQARRCTGQALETASWSLAGTPLPWEPVHADRLLPQMVAHTVGGALHWHTRSSALRLRPAFEPVPQDSHATIPVERITAPMLVITGQDDQVWSSSVMGRQILQRRADFGASADRHLDFPETGHTLSAPITPTTVPRTAVLVTGGTAPGTARAQRTAWPVMLEFLGKCSV